MPRSVTSPAELQPTNSQLHGLVVKLAVDFHVARSTSAPAKLAFHVSSALASRSPPDIAGATAQRRRATWKSGRNLWRWVWGCILVEVLCFMWMTTGVYIGQLLC